MVNLTGPGARFTAAWIEHEPGSTNKKISSSAGANACSPCLSQSAGRCISGRQRHLRPNGRAWT